MQHGITVAILTVVDERVGGAEHDSRGAGASSQEPQASYAVLVRVAHSCASSAPLKARPGLETLVTTKPPLVPFVRLRLTARQCAGSR